jgi:alpha-L-fucosidase
MNPVKNSLNDMNPVKKLTTLIFSSWLLLGVTATYATNLKEESLEAYNSRMDWFVNAQYGMFIHFGLYSHLGGEWKGEQVEWYSEWIQASRSIPREEYAEIINDFNPAGFDADFIARTAKEAGMTYLVITSKHHEGFCLWDSEYTDFDIAGSALKGRDLLAELSEACKKYGIKFGIYYSIIDWNHPAQNPSLTGKRPMQRWGQTLFEKGRKQEYIAYQTNQIKELIQNYDPDLLWFDGDWVTWWELEDGIDLYNTIREADPDIIVNNRVAKRSRFQLDYVTQEQSHFEEAFPNHWEGCYTMNKSWGYKTHDHNWKSAQTIYDKLKDINEKGGNLLLNVGPDGNGEIQPEAVALLLETAELIKAQPIAKRIPNIATTPGIIEKTK